MAFGGPAGPECKTRRRDQLARVQRPLSLIALLPQELGAPPAVQFGGLHSQGHERVHVLRHPAERAHGSYPQLGRCIVLTKEKHQAKFLDLRRGNPESQKTQRG
jgi:hypothetical protein